MIEWTHLEGSSTLKLWILLRENVENALLTLTSLEYYHHHHPSPRKHLPGAPVFNSFRHTYTHTPGSPDIVAWCSGENSARGHSGLRLSVDTDYRNHLRCYCMNIEWFDDMIWQFLTLYFCSEIQYSEKTPMYHFCTFCYAVCTVYKIVWFFFH